MDDGLHGVPFSRRKIDGEITNVAGLDADHRPPFVVTQVRHGLRAGTPGIPDDGGAGILLRQPDAPAQ